MFKHTMRTPKVPTLSDVDVEPILDALPDLYESHRTLSSLHQEVSTLEHFRDLLLSGSDQKTLLAIADHDGHLAQLLETTSDDLLEISAEELADRVEDIVADKDEEEGGTGRDTKSRKSTVIRAVAAVAGLTAALGSAVLIMRVLKSKTKAHPNTNPETKSHVVVTPETPKSEPLPTPKVEGHPTKAELIAYHKAVDHLLRQVDNATRALSQLEEDLVGSRKVDREQIAEEHIKTVEACTDELKACISRIREVADKKSGPTPEEYASEAYLHEWQILQQTLLNTNMYMAAGLRRVMRSTKNLSKTVSTTYNKSPRIQSILAKQLEIIEKVPTVTAQ